MNGGKLESIAALAEDIQKNPLLKGITLSGGEPFMQPKELTNIAKEVHKMGLNVISFTGFVYEKIKQAKLPKQNCVLKNQY